MISTIASAVLSTATPALNVSYNATEAHHYLYTPSATANTSDTTVDVHALGADANGTLAYSHPVFPNYIRTTSMVFCVLLMCLGVVGNIMVPIVILKTKDMRNSTNIFLVNLSVADLLVLLVCTPTVLVEVNSRPETWVLGEEMCKAVPFVELTVAHASVLTILAISFERYYAICEPLKAGYVCTKTRASLICLLAWLLAAVFTSPILTLTRYGFEEYIDGSIVPVCWTKADTAWTTAFFIGLITLFFFLPLAILVILYTIIARTLLVHPSILNPAKNNNVPPNSTLLYRKQVVLMLGTVVLAFFVCLLPFRAFTLWLIIVPTEKVITLGIEGYYNILFFCRIMFHMNSAINPILYNLMSSKFREGFFRLCGFRRRKIKRFINNDKLGRKNTYTNTSISNSTTHTHVTDSFWRRYSSRNASEKSVSVHGSPSKKRHAAEAPPPKVELTQLLHVRKSYSSLSKRFPLHKEESYV